ncbi:cell division protein ZipA [Shewanella khirikhana]|uniref:Cell division protein ZipA n=1 Tax=Shewanella khirikhana TaxID=1965282 RepID=A0ABM7D1L1_9GAMM|nr:cell division protein ZipA [Shewanella khirikhana]AZQ10294.1 Cell division protein ZipA [Shewanella khirikhana]
MEDLQLVLFVLGAIAIIAVLVHGFWSIRKQQPRAIKESSRNPYAMSPGRRDAEGFDADGIGEVRVRKVHADDKPSQDTHAEPAQPAFTKARRKQTAVEPSVAESSVSQPSVSELSGAQYGAAHTEESRSDVDNAPEFALNDEPKVRRSKERQEPVFGQQQAAGDQVQLGLLDDLPEPQQAADYQGYDEDDDDLMRGHSSAATETVYAQQAQEQSQPVQSQPAQQVQPQQEEALPDPRDVLVLHVVAREGQVLAGAELLPCLLELNFKYGEMEIFHRHEDNAGTGKVLFSLANMLKPGVFDPDTMEQFSTHGIVLFMTLPCHGEAVMNFSLMLNSACQLADDLDALVLDGQRQLWSDSTKAQYLARIRASA